MAERFSDRVTHCEMCAKADSAYQRVANMSAKGEGRDKTEWHQIVAFCKTCRVKFEKRDDFVDWMEVSKEPIAKKR